MSLFSKKQAEEDNTQDNRATNVLSIRGALTASNKFRGVCLFLSLIAVIVLSLVNYKLILQQKIIVGIDNEGRPTLLQTTQKTLEPELFCRDFVAHFLSFSPSSIDDNIAYCYPYITPVFAKAYETTMGKDFIRNVKEYGMIQLTTISDIQITDYTDAGFIAIITAGRIKNDNVQKQTVEQKMQIQMKIDTGAITRDNAWGLYVDKIAEVPIS